MTKPMVYNGLLSEESGVLAEFRAPLVSPPVLFVPPTTSPPLSLVASRPGPGHSPRGLWQEVQPRSRLVIMSQLL